MSGKLKFPDDFDDYASDVEAKGWFSGAILCVAGRNYALNFYDPVRLAQTIHDELERSKVFCEPNLCAVRSVTRLEMKEAAIELLTRDPTRTLMET